MRCKACGHNLPEGILVCKNCGKPIELTPFFENDTYVNIGHPLGYVNNSDTLVACIDSGDRQVRMSREEFHVWNTLEVTSGETAAFERLVNKNIILNIKKKDKNMKFLECVLCRQGVGNIYKGKHSVQLGIMPIHITELQMNIWRMANGTDTVALILQNIASDNKQVVENILILLKLDLIYIKYKV